MGTQILGLVPLSAGPVVAYMLRGKGALLAITGGILAAWLVPVLFTTALSTVTAAETV